MKPVLLLVHGWGFDASFWDLLRARFDADETIAWDLGFFGPPAQPALPPERPVVAVGHSFGLLWLLHHRPVAWRALVSINGFACFARRETFPEGVAPRPLHRMIARLEQAPAQVVAEFVERCGGTAPSSARPDPARLAEGLEALAQWDERPASVAAALCGAADVLLTPEMSRASFAPDRLHWRAGGHLLPREDPDWCAQHLRRVLARAA